MRIGFVFHEKDEKRMKKLTMRCVRNSCMSAGNGSKQKKKSTQHEPPLNGKVVHMATVIRFSSSNVIIGTSNG